MKDFDRSIEYGRRVLLARFSPDETEAIIREARREYETLIPDIPYIGGRGNPLSWNLVTSVWFLAIYRVLKARSLPVEDIG